jgi:transcriptional regulator with XRE-family HTH domain
MPTIKKLRMALGLSQEALAQAIGKSCASVRTYEDGRKLPPEVLGRLLYLASKAGLAELVDEIEHQAAVWYDRPIPIAEPDGHPSATESPEERKKLHVLLDYVLDSAGTDVAQALRETIRIYFAGVRCLADPVFDHETFLDPDPDSKAGQEDLLK